MLLNYFEYISLISTIIQLTALMMLSTASDIYTSITIYFFCLIGFCYLDSITYISLFLQYYIIISFITFMVSKLLAIILIYFICYYIY